MPIFYYEPDTAPVVPSAHAHQANATATHAADARRSLEAKKRQIDDELRHPVYHRIRQVIQGPHFLLHNILGLGAFPGVVIWEAIVSREIYAVVLPIPWLWWVPIVVCAGVGVWASGILAESSPEFQLRNTPDPSAERERTLTRVLADLYDRSDRKTMGNWTSHPATGLFIAIVVLSVIYGFSLQRVALLKQQDKDTDLLQVYLPVILYLFEIALGMPAYFVAVCHWKRMQLQRRTADLTVLTRNLHTLRQTTLEQYTHYLEEYHGYNTWAAQKQQPQAPLIPANRELRRLFQDELSYDPMAGVAGVYMTDNHGSSTPVNSHEAPDAAANGASPTIEEASAETQAQQAPKDGSREADLLRLVDEQNASQNGRF